MNSKIYQIVKEQKEQKLSEENYARKTSPELRR